jgi:cell volume regulation protein A
LLGVLLGSYGLSVVAIEDISGIAPIFISFTLLFLLYDGAFTIDLASFTQEFNATMRVTLFNFFLSSAAVAVVFLAFLVDWKTALLAGFTLGGISSAFAIPLLKQLRPPKKAASILTLESAFTDVLCIVLALAMMDLILMASFDVKAIASTIVSLFAIAGLVGVVAGVVWVFILTHVLRRNAMNMITIAFLLLVYVATEYLGGNGAIACLFFGIVLKNSLELRNILREIVGKERVRATAKNHKVGISVTSSNEEAFYHEISFFVKTLFFVYIGILIDFSDWRATVIGLICAVAIVIARRFSRMTTKDLPEVDRALIAAVFARGLAPAVIVQIAVQRSVPGAAFLSQVVMIFILGTIILSSAAVFLYQRAHPR